MPGVRRASPQIDTLRLKDRVGPGVRVLLVGINPGVRSAQIGHHFAGYSNRFWKLLFDAGLTPVLLKAEDDVRLSEWGFGITNLIARPTPGIDTLTPGEYVEGLATLRRKVRRWKPEAVAFIGVTLMRSIFVPSTPLGRRVKSRGGRRSSLPVALGEQRETFEGARVFVLPNPSGRNANYSYAEMLEAFRSLKSQSRQSLVSRQSSVSRQLSASHAR